MISWSICYYACVNSLSISLNPQQQKAVEHRGGPAIVLAGAGSGKTTVLTERALWLIKSEQVDPTNILLVTFTNKAAGEMKQRITKSLHLQVPSVGTFHSFCARFLRKHSSALGRDNSFTIYDTDDQLATIKLIYKEHDIDPKQLSFRSALSQISTAKNESLSPESYRGYARSYSQETVAKIYEWYQQKLSEFNAFDFDDLLLSTVNILQNNASLLSNYQETFAHVLVDEYQDTNQVQYELTKLLASPQNNLFVVGDFSQSIYAWRGADYRNMLKLTDDFTNTTEYRLEQNYRSHQAILDAATQIISNNKLHPILSLWTNQQETIPLVLKSCRSDSEEANRVVRWIDENSKHTSLSGMAILYRTNAQSRVFEEALLGASIPYRVVGGTQFYNRKEIKDLLSYTHLIANPADSIHSLRAIKIGKRKYQQFLDWHNETKLTANLTPSEILTGVIKATKYLDQFDQSLPEDLSRLENIAELLRVASKFETLPEFLENIALIQDGYMHSAQNSNDGGGVQLMSLHSAKGLEFSIVFLVGCEEGLLPHSRSLFDPESIEEERRLCYVGITRAKKQLYFSYAKNRYSYAGSSYSLPSRFIKDISPKLFSSDSDISSTINSNATRKIVSDDLLDQILSGELDAEALID